MASNEYHIEKRGVPVAVLMATGEQLVGDVFLQAWVPHRRGREEVADLLNGDEPFFPMRCADGAIRFLPKDRVVEAELREPGSHAPEGRPGAREAVVELVLEAGGCYTACVFFEVPSARPRLLDWLNRQDERFLLVHAAAGPRLVNRHRLTAVRPLD